MEDIESSSLFLREPKISLVEDTFNLSNWSQVQILYKEIVFSELERHIEDETKLTTDVDI